MATAASTTATAPAVVQTKEWKMFDGLQRVFSHDSTATKTSMSFAVYFPPQALAAGAKVPVVFFLSGLTCTWENFVTKAGAQRVAAELGIAIVAPDTSPRGAGVPGEAESWDFGVGAGFYVDATEAPWSTNYCMYSYVTSELPALLASAPAFGALDMTRVSISGHSMGGMGALQIALKNAGSYRSVSAFSPICNPSKAPWGIKAFGGYLGSPDTGKWAAYDPTAIVASDAVPAGSDALHILIDQGAADDFLGKKQLLPEAFLEAAAAKGVPVTYKLREGYDHSYYYIATFIEEHLRHHAKYLHA